MVTTRGNNVLHLSIEGAVASSFSSAVSQAYEDIRMLQLEAADIPIEPQRADVVRPTPTIVEALRNEGAQNLVTGDSNNTESFNTLDNSVSVDIDGSVSPSFRIALQSVTQQVEELQNNAGDIQLDFGRPNVPPIVQPGTTIPPVFQSTFTDVDSEETDIRGNPLSNRREASTLNTELQKYTELADQATSGTQGLVGAIKRIGPAGLVIGTVATLLIGLATLAVKTGREFQTIEDSADAAGLSFERYERMARTALSTTTDLGQARSVIGSIGNALADAAYNYQVFGDVSERALIAAGNIGFDYNKILSGDLSDPLALIEEFRALAAQGVDVSARDIQNIAGLDIGTATEVLQQVQLSDEEFQAGIERGDLADIATESEREILKDANEAMQALLIEVKDKMVPLLTTIAEYIVDLANYLMDKTDEVEGGAKVVAGVLSGDLEQVEEGAEQLYNPNALPGETVSQKTRRVAETFGLAERADTTTEEAFRVQERDSIGDMIGKAFFGTNYEDINNFFGGDYGKTFEYTLFDPVEDVNSPDNISNALAPAYGGPPSQPNFSVTINGDVNDGNIDRIEGEMFDKYLQMLNNGQAR